MQQMDKTISQAVRLVLKDKSPQIINHLCNMNEYIEKGNFTIQERKEYLTLFSQYSISDLKKIKRALYARLAEELVKPERTYLETFRTIIAMDSLYPNRKIPNSNPKIKFCKYLWSIPLPPLSEVLPQIALLDK